MPFDAFGNLVIEGDNPKKSGLRKVADIPKPCTSPQHEPPGNIVLEPGVYEYTCPACGKTISFTVPRIVC